MPDRCRTCALSPTCPPPHVGDGGSPTPLATITRVPCNGKLVECQQVESDRRCVLKSVRLAQFSIKYQNGAQRWTCQLGKSIALWRMARCLLTTYSADADVDNFASNQSTDPTVDLLDLQINCYGCATVKPSLIDDWSTLDK